MEMTTAHQKTQNIKTNYANVSLNFKKEWQLRFKVTILFLYSLSSSLALISITLLFKSFILTAFLLNNLNLRNLFLTTVPSKLSELTVSSLPSVLSTCISVPPDDAILWACTNSFISLITSIFPKYDGWYISAPSIGVFLFTFGENLAKKSFTNLIVLS